MEKKVHKYESPVLEVIETKMEGVLCQSCTSDGNGGGHGGSGDAPACNVGGFPGLPGQG